MATFKMLKKKHKKIKLCSKKDFEVLYPQNLYFIKKEGYHLLYFKFNNKLYVFKNKCPHQGYPFDGGKCSENGKLICPVHQYGFDVESGRGAGTAVRKYEVEFTEGHYYALIDYLSLF